MGASGVTIAYSTHRPETLSRASLLMREHASIVLEEPETPGFHAMLRGEMDIEEYLLATEYEYPAFAERAAAMLQELAATRRVIQLDPYMDVLVSIHEFFTDGFGPVDLEPDTVQAVVYDVEHRWTTALLNYYETSGTRSFDDLVHAVIAFARVDAERGRMRDAMRARGLLGLMHGDDPLPRPVYVEAGSIHFHLLNQLSRLLDSPLRVAYLMEDVSRRVWGRRQVLGPGDVLTMLFTYFPQYDKPRAALLAAQSLIHVKIQQKEEIVEELENPAPHTCDEAWSAGLAMALNHEECRELYERISRLPTPHARRLAEKYLNHLGRLPLRHF